MNSKSPIPLRRSRFIGPFYARRTGFTLVELLVVIAIMLILVALVIPAVQGISRGVSITAAGEEIAATIGMARQRATSLSRNVSVRFYAPTTASDAPFASYQVWEQEDFANAASWKAVDKEKQLPVGLIISPDATFSAILTLSIGTDTATSRKFAEFFFSPSGSVAAPKEKACLTIHAEAAPKTGGGVAGLPANFAVINIEPFNGRPEIIRP